MYTFPECNFFGQIHKHFTPYPTPSHSPDLHFIDNDDNDDVVDVLSTTDNDYDDNDNFSVYHASSADDNSDDDDDVDMPAVPSNTASSAVNDQATSSTEPESVTFQIDTEIFQRVLRNAIMDSERAQIVSQRSLTEVQSRLLDSFSTYRNVYGFSVFYSIVRTFENFKMIPETSETAIEAKLKSSCHFCRKKVKKIQRIY